MNELPKLSQPPPRHYIQPKTIWNDNKQRTLICIEMWESAKGYEIVLLVLYGEKQYEFVCRPWTDIYEAIKSGKMIRNITEEFKYLKAKQNNT